MKVDHTTNHPVTGGEASGTQQGGRVKSSPAAASQETRTAGAKAEISKKSKEFAQAKSVAKATPDVRADRVAELKQRIADGKYKVDAPAIADRMVDEHLKMADLG